MVDVSTMTDAEQLDLANQLATHLRNSLSKGHSIASYTLNSKLPWKADLLRDALMHRMSDLADTALDLYAKGRLVPAFIQTRAAVETVALLFVLEKRCREFLKNWDSDVFGEFVEQALSGSRDESTPIKSINVKTIIKHLDREYSGFEKMYDVLCEFTHPNWSGVLGAYAVIDREKWTVSFGRELREPPLAFGLAPLIQGLSIFNHYYNELADLLKEMNDRFEAQR